MPSLLAACSLAAKAQTIDEGFTIEAPDSVAEGDTVKSYSFLSILC